MSDTATLARPTAPAVAARANRRRLLIWLSIAVILGAVLFGGWWLMTSGKSVETDNAYVGADIGQVTPLVAGPVAKVLVRETEVVKAGTPLVILDDSDARIAVAQALAALGSAERRVRAMGANDTALAGQLAARDADIARMKSDLDRARTDLDRRQALSASGAVSGDELTNARNKFSEAQAMLAQSQAARAAAVGSREANQVMISGVSLEQNPEVLSARARLDAAQLALDRTVIKAPMDGVISKKQVELGQQVAMGVPIMAIVPTTEAYVDANFKEVQLKKVHAGQPVTLTSDLYGKEVVFHGKVRGLSGGTGAAFSLIPAQNASGNWIKVVQRLPVRIDLEPKELAQHPLRVGLSMKAKVDISGAK
jgi:membrane fusion protein (multidrug efflux system)